MNSASEEPYAYPPFCLIARCLAKVNKDQAVLVIITPTWQTQAYYPLLLEMSIAVPILLPPMKDLLMSPQGTHHPLIESQVLKLAAWKVSGSEKKQRAFRRGLPNFLSAHGDRALSHLTTAAGDTGVAV